MSKLLDRLRERRDALSTAIDILEQEIGLDADRPARKTYTKRAAKAALALHASSNGDAPVVQRKQHGREGSPVRPAGYAQTRKQREINRGTTREIESVPLPAGVEIGGLDFDRALTLALAAVKRPLPTPELTLLLQTAGVKFPKLSMPPRRFVGLAAARLVTMKQVKRTSTGWAATKRAGQ